VREQLLCRQIARLAPVENRLGDVRGEIAEADNPSEIGSAPALLEFDPNSQDLLASLSPDLAWGPVSML
jgi:hypothetical protein